MNCNKVLIRYTCNKIIMSMIYNAHKIDPKNNNKKSKNLEQAL